MSYFLSYVSVDNLQSVNVGVTPIGNLTSDDAQNAFEELQADIDTLLVIEEVE